jgi:hypothetical protein
MGAISDDDLLLTMRSLAQAIEAQKPGFISDAALTKALDEARAILKSTPAVL